MAAIDASRLCPPSLMPPLDEDELARLCGPPGCSSETPHCEWALMLLRRGARGCARHAAAPFIVRLRERGGGPVAASCGCAGPPRFAPRIDRRPPIVEPKGGPTAARPPSPLCLSLGDSPLIAPAKEPDCERIERLEL